MMEQEDTHKQHLPELYSKTLILMFAILFSTIFAAALLIVNLRNLGKNRPALFVGLFAFAYVIATALVMQAFALSPILTIVANVIGAAILNEFFWNRYIGSEFAFEKKSWLKPTLISIAIAIGFFFVLMGSM